MGKAIVGLLSGVIFFLSLWIVLPAPNLFFLRLAVGAPEISPLLGIAALCLLLLALWLYQRDSRKSWAFSIPLILLTISLIFSSLPLIQRPKAMVQANQSMAIAFGNTDRSASPAFSWSHFFSGMPTAAVRYQSQIPFATPDGQPLSLDLYQPPSPGRYPAVIAIYGGSWARGSPAESAQMGRYLASRGYVVVAIDYRHTPDYRFPAQIEDVTAALSFVSDRADEYEIDRDRIGLLGWSAGAHLAMLAGFQPASSSASSLANSLANSLAKPLAIRSIVDYYGPVDLAVGYAEPPSPDPIDVRQVLLAFIGGPPSELPAAYAEASPMTYVRQAEPNSLPSVLLIYGGRDHLVESRFGRALYDALIESENTAVWVKIPWAEHAFDKIFNGVSNQMALHFVEQFLAQTLGK